MRIAYFDAIGGAAGDMFVGALLDAGLDLEALRRELRKLDLDGYHLSRHTVRKQSIAASQFLVHVEGEGHHHDHAAGPEERHGRTLSEIQELIAGSALDGEVKTRAAAIFQLLGEAEAKVHGVPVVDVHFHEVGEIDSIVDVVGAALGLHLLGIERVYCSPLPTGSGTVQTQHGTFPVPAPATLEICARRHVPTRASAVRAEQVTPTGAAILATVASFEQPSMRPERIGYGSGESDLQIPNVLRVWIGEAEEGGVEIVDVLETNVDDMSPEIAAHAAERCFQAGALDVLLTPVVMKKGRPGTKFEVLCRPEDTQRSIDALLMETTTLGVRVRTTHRHVADREITSVETPFGAVRVKVKRLHGRAVAASPEYEDCRQRAEAASVPLIDVYTAALAAGQSLLQKGP